MSPLRRYLRLTPYSVLEVRIYLDNPSDLHRWLLHATSPVLPRVLEAVRPLVGPKLKEENERARARRGKGVGKKGRGVKDVVVADDFEVSVFLTELSTPHSLLRKRKFFGGEKGRVGSFGGKMTGSREVPVEVGDEVAVGEGVVVREESQEEKGGLEEIPAATGDEAGDKYGLFVSDGEEEDDSEVRSQGEKQGANGNEGIEEQDGKKKLAMDTTYDGFRIYGRILCLVVKRKGVVKGKQVTGGTGQAVMEEWIASTQMGEGRMMDD